MTRSLAYRLALFAAALLVPHVAAGAPEVKYLFPPGAGRGQTTEVTVAGNFPQWPPRAWVDKPGLTITPHDESGNLSVAIVDDAELGVYWLRFFDDSGASAPKPFVVGALTESVEQEPNDALDSPQRLNDSAYAASGATVNGKLGKRGDVDVFAVPAKRGQTLVADLDSRKLLNSPLDAVLQIVSPEGFVQAFNDDQLGLDPRLAVEIPYDGVWLVRVFGFPAAPNSTIALAGGEDYLYRLTVTTGPCLDYVLPMAARHGRSAVFGLAGWNLPSELQEITLPAPDTDELVLEHPLLINTLRLPVVPYEVVLETEPSSADEPQNVVPPTSVTGKIDRPGDRDVFTFTAKKDKRLSIRVESRSLGFALDPVLTLADDEGKQLATADDTAGSRDASLLHAVAADGRLRLIVSDRHREGGLDYVYRFTLEPARTDFALSLDMHQVVVVAGAEVDLPVTVERLHGHGEPIAIAVEGLPAGVTAAKVTSTSDDDTAGNVTLTLSASTEAAPVAVPIRVIARAGGAESRTARITVPGHDVPMVDLWLTVTQTNE